MFFKEVSSKFKQSHIAQLNYKPIKIFVDIVTVISSIIRTENSILPS